MTEMQMPECELNVHPRKPESHTYLDTVACIVRLLGYEANYVVYASYLRAVMLQNDLVNG